MTSTLSFPIPGENELESAHDPAGRITLSLERAKGWLAVALEANEIEQIVELKCQAEAIRVYTVQRELGKDAEFAAQEIVRRAQRCIGLAIRKGQEQGTIAKQGDIGRHRDLDDARERHLDRPTDFVGREELSSSSGGIYAMTDGVSDEQFDAALEAAKAQGNLSRANVVRHVRGVADPSRWERLAELADQGHTSHQIGALLGVTPEAVRLKARDLGLTIRADVVLGSTRKKIDHNRVLRGITDTIESLYPSCDPAELGAVDRELLAHGLKVMNQAMPAFARLRKRIRKEIDNG